MTLEAAAGELGASTATVRRMEHARILPTRAKAALCLRAYGADEEETSRLLAELDRARDPGWWHRYRKIVPAYMDGLMDLESEAEVIRVYAPALVPELLRTPATPATCWPCATPRRAGRAGPAPGTPPGPAAAPQGRLWAVVEETALRRPVGDAAVLAEQLDALDRYTADPGRDGVTLQWIGADTAPTR
ncbi:Scr1 family TA system antitoxin-like transcriptional regulator [Streptomyces sp. M19]